MLVFLSYKYGVFVFVVSSVFLVDLSLLFYYFFCFCFCIFKMLTSLFFLNISFFLIFDKNFSTFIGIFLQWKMELEVLIFRFSLDFSIAFWLFFSFYFVGLLLLFFFIKIC